MKFDVWTFLFQIINFAVLLFILKRILFKPLKEIILKRRETVIKLIDDAEKTKKEAEEIREKRLAELENLKDSKERALDDMVREAAGEREQILSGARKEAESIMAKERVLLETEKKRFDAELKTSAIDSVTIWSENLLRDITDEELHKAIVRRAIDTMRTLSPEDNGMREGADGLHVEIASAYPFEDETSVVIRNLFESNVCRRVTIGSVVDKGLIAGVRIKIYDKIYDFSLKGQVDAFKNRLGDPR